DPGGGRRAGRACGAHEQGTHSDSGSRPPLEFPAAPAGPDLALPHFRARGLGASRSSIDSLQPHGPTLGGRCAMPALIQICIVIVTLSLLAIVLMTVRMMSRIGRATEEFSQLSVAVRESVVKIDRVADESRTLVT